MTRLMRILKALDLLISGRGFTSDEIALECGCSRRTVFRDLGMIRKSGIPLHFDSASMRYTIYGRDLLVTHRITENEFIALAIASELSLAPQHYLFEARKTVWKLFTDIRKDVRSEIRALLDSCSVERRDFVNRHAEEETIDALMKAIRKKNDVRIYYWNGGEGACTRFTPDKIVANQSGWKAVGKSSCHRRRVTLDIKSISSLKVLDEVDPLKLQYVNK